MMADFDEIFGSPELQDIIPDGYIDILNQTAPPNTHYERVENDRVVLKGDNGKIEIGGLIFEPDNQQKKALGDSYTPDDLMKYLYNSQTPGKFRLEKRGVIKVNGKNTPIDSLEKSLWGTAHATDANLVMYPDPLCGEFNMTVGDGEIEQSLHMVRKRNNSISEWLFESDDPEKLQISMRVDPDASEKPIAYTVRIGWSSTVSGLLENIRLYNAFAGGKMLLDGQDMAPTVDIRELKLVDESDILFWEKVLQIEKELDIQFTPMEVSMDMAVQVELLYQSLIKRNPTRYEQRIDSLKGKATSQNSENPPQQSIGKSMLIEFAMLRKLDVLGQKLCLPGLIGICNAILQECIQNGDSVELKFADESEDKKLFATILLFRNADELEEYRKGNTEERTRKMKEAKFPVEYM